MGAKKRARSERWLLELETAARRAAAVGRTAAAAVTGGGNNARGMAAALAFEDGFVFEGGRRLGAAPPMAGGKGRGMGRGQGKGKGGGRPPPKGVRAPQGCGRC